MTARLMLAVLGLGCGLGVSAAVADMRGQRGALDTTTHVEIKGKLFQFFSEEEVTIHPRPTRSRGRWYVQSGTTTQSVTFNRADLRELAERLDGQTVLVSGVLVGNTVVVETLRSDPDYIKRTVTTRIIGKLNSFQMTIGNARGEWPFTCWVIVVDGKVYRLELSGTKWEKLAQQMKDQPVEVVGTLNGNVLTVSELKPYLLEAIRPLEAK